MRRFSKKRTRQNTRYTKLAKSFKQAHPICQAKLTRCTGETTQIHHKKGRIGKLLTDESNFLAVCFNCHRQIEENPEAAKEMGFSKSRLQVI